MLCARFVLALALALALAAPQADGACAAGTGMYAGECVACAPGLFKGVALDTGCHVCPDGKYALVPGQQSCVDGCPAGQFPQTLTASAPFFTCNTCTPAVYDSATHAATACSQHQDSRRWATGVANAAALRAWVPTRSANLLEQGAAPGHSAPVSGFESVLMQTGAEHVAQCVTVASGAEAGTRPTLGPCVRTGAFAATARASRALFLLLEHNGVHAARARCNCAAEVFRLPQDGVLPGWLAAAGNAAPASLMGAFALRVFVPRDGAVELRLSAAVLPPARWQGALLSVLVRGLGTVQFAGGLQRSIPHATSWSRMWHYASPAPEEVLLTLRGANGAELAEIELDNLELSPVLSEAFVQPPPSGLREVPQALVEPAPPGLLQVDVRLADPWLRAMTDSATADIMRKTTAGAWASLALSVFVSVPVAVAAPECLVRPVILSDLPGAVPEDIAAMLGLDGMACAIAAGADSCDLSLPLAAMSSGGHIGLVLGADCAAGAQLYASARAGTARYACADGAVFPRFRARNTACAQCWAPAAPLPCAAGQYVKGCYSEAPRGRHARCRDCRLNMPADSLAVFVPPAARAYRCARGCPPGAGGSETPDCVLCAPGSYSTVTHEAACVPCPAGSAGLVRGGSDAASCSAAPACERGLVFDSASMQCTPCPAGTFKDNAGSAPCAPCPALSTTDARGGAVSALQCLFCTRHAFWRGARGCARCPTCQSIAEDRHQRTACERCPFAPAPAGDAADRAQCPVLGLASACFAQAEMQDVHACAESVLAGAEVATLAELQFDAEAAPPACLAAVYSGASCRGVPPTLKLDPSYGLGMPSSAAIADSNNALYMDDWWTHCAAKTFIVPKANVCKVYLPGPSGGAATRRRVLYVPSGYPSLQPSAAQAVAQSAHKTTASNYGCLVCGALETRDPGLELEHAPGMTVFALSAPESAAVAAKTQFFDVARLGLDFLKAERVVPDYEACMRDTTDTETSVNVVATEDVARRICMLPTRLRSNGVNSYMSVDAANQYGELAALDDAWAAHFSAKDRAESAPWGLSAALQAVTWMAVRVHMAPAAGSEPAHPGLELATDTGAHTLTATWAEAATGGVATASAVIDGTWLASAGREGRVRLAVPAADVLSIEVWLCSEGGALLCTQVAEAASAAALQYYVCDEQEFATSGARLQHGAHLAALRSTLGAAYMCGLRDPAPRLARAASRAASAQSFATREAGGLCA